MDAGSVHAVHVEAAAVIAVVALAAQIAALFVLVLKVAVALRLDGQHIILQAQRDVLLFEAGQIALHQVGVTGVADVGLELRQTIVTKEGTVQILKITEGVVAALNQHSHKSYLLLSQLGFVIVFCLGAALLGAASFCFPLTILRIHPIYELCVNTM